MSDKPEIIYEVNRKYTTEAKTFTNRAVNYTRQGGKETRLIHVLPNMNNIDCLSDQPELTAKLRACLRANISNNCNAGYIELHGHQNVMEWVDDLYDEGFELAIVWGDGCWPHGDTLERLILEKYDNDWKIDWMAAGKIENLRDQGEYLHWDYSYPIIINLKNWNHKGRPHIFTDSHGAITYQTDSGKPNENNPRLVWAGDWLDRLGYKDLTCRERFLDALITQTLKNRGFVIGLDKDPDIAPHIHSDDVSEDLDEMLSWVHKNNLLEEANDVHELRGQSDAYSEPRKEFFTFKILKLQIVYITNTEGIPNDPIEKNKFNTLILPCSGLHQFYHLLHNRDSLKRVVWFDFNPHSVNWIKHIVENWDGVDFKGFVEKNRHTITDSGEVLDHNIIYDEDMVDEFMEKMDMSDQEWKEFMVELRTKENIFANVDAVKEYKTLVEHAGTDSEVFIQLTNIWQYEVNYLNTDGLDAQLAFINLINDICKANKSLYLTGDTPMGTHYRYKNIKELKGIF